LLVAIRNWTFLLGPSLIPGVNALLLGYLMYRSGLGPRVIPVLGLTGGPLLLASATTTMFGINHPVSVLSGIAVAPIFVWELSLGVYVVVRGFKPSGLAALAADSGSPDRLATPASSRTVFATNRGAV
jgi:hypothetical protein